MLREIFLTDELVDNLRVIHKIRVKREETFELIKVINANNETVMMPLSERTLYDIFALIGGNLNKEFNTKLDEDLSKYRKYMELKSHDTYIEGQINRVLEEAEKENKGVVKQYSRKLHSSNTALTTEFNKYKLRSLINDLFAEEQGLLDVHYISNYIQKYGDIEIDFEKILIDSINSYLDMVSSKDDGHYPRVTDYGTAQCYFASIVYRGHSYIRTPEGIPLGRMYYREVLNKDLLEYVETSYTNTGWITYSLYLAAWIGIVLGKWCFDQIGIFTCIYFITAMILITIYPLVLRKRRITNRLKKIFEYENAVLSEISAEEHKTIVKWFNP